MKFEDAFHRCAATLGLGQSQSAAPIRERDFAVSFWHALAAAADKQPNNPPPRAVVLFEQALVWRMLAYRLEASIAKSTPKTHTTSIRARRIPAAQTLDTLAKTHERLRKIMKELMDLLGADGETEKIGLAALLEPLLEKSGHIMEEALEQDARKKAAERKRARRKPNQSAAQSV